MTLARASMILGLVLFAACASSPAGQGAGETQRTNPAHAGTHPPARIRAGDALRIRFGDEIELNAWLVDAEGRVVFPLLGPFAAQGRTTRELELALTKEFDLESDWIHIEFAHQTTCEWFVTDLAMEAFEDGPAPVVLADCRPYYMLGGVTRPGAYLYRDGLTVREAVAAAGGFTSRANRRIVYIKHSDERNETPNRLARAEVRAGDTIRIPE